MRGGVGRDGDDEAGERDGKESGVGACREPGAGDGSGDGGEGEGGDEPPVGAQPVPARVTRAVALVMVMTTSDVPAA